MASTQIRDIVVYYLPFSFLTHTHAHKLAQIYQHHELPSFCGVSSALTTLGVSLVASHVRLGWFFFCMIVSVGLRVLWFGVAFKHIFFSSPVLNSKAFKWNDTMLTAQHSHFPFYHPPAVWAFQPFQKKWKQFQRFSLSLYIRFSFHFHLLTVRFLYLLLSKNIKCTTHELRMYTLCLVVVDVPEGVFGVPDFAHKTVLYAISYVTFVLCTNVQQNHFRIFHSHYSDGSLCETFPFLFVKRWYKSTSGEFEQFFCRFSYILQSVSTFLKGVVNRTKDKTIRLVWLL